jgi:hypothetical protein
LTKVSDLKQTESPEVPGFQQASFMNKTNKLFERTLPWLLPLMVLLAAVFFCIGGWFIPVIGSYY